MDQFVIDGGRPLKGSVTISGSKNASLPILIATLLTDETCLIENVPVHLRDLKITFRLLESLGKAVAVSGHAVEVSARGTLKTRAPYDLVRQMRASVLVSGPLLARFGRVRVPVPGGCAIGLRPIDIHIKGFEDLGAKRFLEEGDVVLRARSLKPARLKLKFPSVGATENLMIAAAALEGETVIDNAAREPEIEDLARFLAALGAEVSGAGSSRVSVRGRSSLHGARHAVDFDRIEAGTWLLFAAASGGSLRLQGARLEPLKAVALKMEKAGARVSEAAGGLQVSMRGRPKAVSIATGPFPAFPTDLQAPWMAWMCRARGTASVRESIFENRFLHAAELSRMGARIEAGGSSATIEGVEALYGAPVMASDIRGGAALVTAALSARGRTVIQRVYHIDRGYERLEVKLRSAGAGIRRVRK